MNDFDGWLDVYDLHRLRLLRELDFRGTLAAVAEALGYSPSSISHQLATLEREVGVRLLEPRGRGVQLTAAGKLLVAHTAEVLIRLERAEADIAALSGTVTGTLRVATFQTAAHTLIPSMIDSLADTHPGVDVVVSHIYAHAAIPALQALDFDLVLYEEYPHNPLPPQADILTEPVAIDPMLLLVPESSPARGLHDLADARWVSEPVGAPARTWTTQTCHAAGFEALVVFDTPDALLHAHLVAQGRVVAFVPELAFTPRPTVRVLETGQSRTIATAIRTGSADSPVVRAAQDALRRGRS